MQRGKINITRSAVNLKMMLEGGQCFRWKEMALNTWYGVVRDVLWILRQSEDYLEYETLSYKNNELTDDKLTKKNAELKDFLIKYLRLDEDLQAMYDCWANKDAHFKEVASHCFGIRILFQDPVENLFSFICSSNNNISRISSLVEKLCTLYGEKIVEYNGKSYYSFPTISKLSAPTVEDTLRKAGFGYRAKYINNSAKLLETLGGEEWLLNLRTKNYQTAKSELIKLQGIGAKVADCICLMSLNHLDALPVDTHVFQIASQHYIPRLKGVKNVTDKVYNEIGDFFRELYGNRAGWAHTVLFCSDLKKFQNEIKQSDKQRRPKKRKAVNN